MLSEEARQRLEAFKRAVAELEDDLRIMVDVEYSVWDYDQNRYMDVDEDGNEITAEA